MTFRVINDVASADIARRDLLGKTAGVMRVVKDFALGLDLKGASPAFVYVLILDHKEAQGSMIDQMLARG